MTRDDRVREMARHYSLSGFTRLSQLSQQTLDDFTAQITAKERSMQTKADERKVV